MSVPEGKRSKPKMEVQTLAIRLAVYTDEICSNEKRFPKRRRWISANKLISYADDIVINIYAANEIRVSTQGDFDLRRSYQTQTISDVGKMLGLLQRVYESKYYNLDGISTDYWTGLIIGVKNKLMSWRNSDMEAWKKKQAETEQSPEGMARAVSEKVAWWLRSPNVDNTNNARNVNTDGSLNNNNASNSRGFAPDYFLSQFEVSLKLKPVRIEIRRHCPDPQRANIGD